MIASALLLAWLAIAPTEGSFETLVEQARVHFQAKRYAQAAAALEAAYGHSPNVDVLFNWANAERLAGRCDRAIGLYGHYLEQGGEYEKVAQQRRDECTESLPEGVVAIDVLEDDSEPAVEDPTAPPPESVLDEPIDEPTADPPTGPIVDDPPRTRPDVLGWTLTGVGIAGLATGSALVGVAYARDANATEQPSHNAYLDRIQGASRLSIAGWTVLGIGAATAIGGVVRLVVVRKRGSSGRVAMGPASLRVRF